MDAFWLSDMTPTKKTDDNQSATSKTDLQELFPALRLLRASGLAIDPRKMLLGGVALVLLVSGDWLIAFLPFAPGEDSIHGAIRNESSAVARLLGCAGFTARQQFDSWLSWDAAAFALLTPVRTLIEPARVIFQTGQSWSTLAFAWTQFIWALIVWSLVGGALCRMNALQFARRKRIGIRAAFVFSRRQFTGYLVAALVPLSTAVILLGVHWLLRYLDSLAPSVNGVVLGLGWFFVLFTSFLMGVLLLGLIIGWPLMIAAISSEDSDGFDGLSRSFGYLFDRPWQASVFAISSLPVFMASRILVATLIGLTVSLAANVVDQEEDSKMLDVRLAIPLLNSPAGDVADQMERTLSGESCISLSGSMQEFAIFAWTCIPALLYVGFGPSFFWSATTVSYFLLRQSDDGTPLDSVVDWPETQGTRSSDSNGHRSHRNSTG